MVLLFIAVVEITAIRFHTCLWKYQQQKYSLDTLNRSNAIGTGDCKKSKSHESYAIKSNTTSMYDM